MRKLLIILFLLITNVTFAQTTFTQTFVDRCTGQVSVVTANFVNGSATVAFYNRIRTFTYQQFLNGELQQWLSETYVWWSTLSPCATATQQTQQAQQTAQTASQAASAASSAASSATSATQSTGGTTNGTTAGNSTESTNTNSSSSTESTSSEGSSGGGEGESKGGGETSEGGESSEGEGGEAETEGEESKEEVKEEESSDEKEKEKEKEEKDKKKKEMLPIQLRADMMANQALLGNYDVVMSIGANQSSIFGDETYGATAMIWSNLRQIAINGSYTKVHMQKFNVSQLVHQDHSHYAKGSKVTTKDPIVAPQVKVSSITSASVGYMNNFGNGTIVASVNKLKPMEKWGTAGVGVMLTNSFGEGRYQSTSIGYNILYTNVIMITPRIQYAPAIIWTQTPYVTRVEWVRDRWNKSDLSMENQLNNQRIHGMAILANSFTIQLTRRFSFNAGVTLIKSTDPLIPLIKSFMIGTKLPF
jgi:hypothetical protein